MIRFCKFKQQQQKKCIVCEAAVWHFLILLNIDLLYDLDGRHNSIPQRYLLPVPRTYEYVTRPCQQEDCETN